MTQRPTFNQFVKGLGEAKMGVAGDANGYRRFHIETMPAPPMFRAPNKFDVHANRLRLAAMLFQEAVHYRLNRSVVLSRPCIYGVFSGRLGGFKPIKERCVGCMRCVQEYPHIMTVRHSDAYKALGNESWTPEGVFTIYYEASTGKIPVKGMGYKGGFGGEGWDGMWTDMSEIVRPTRDGVYGREYISTTVDIGRKPLRLNFTGEDSADGGMRIVQSPLPVMFDNLSLDHPSVNAERAVSEAAKRLGIYHSSTHQTTIGDPFFIPIVNTRNLQFSETSLQTARIIELEFESVEKELPPIRKLYPSSLVSVRIALDDDSAENSCQLIEKGVDVLHLVADPRGLDRSRTPKHVSLALKAVHRRLVDRGLRDLTTIIVSGGITLAEHVPKAIICGADMVGLDSTLLVALQSRFVANGGEVRGVSGLEPRTGLDVDWGAQRLVNLMASWHDQLIEILSAMGIRDVRRLRGDVGRSMTDEELREEAFQGIEMVG